MTGARWAQRGELAACPEAPLDMLLARWNSWLLSNCLHVIML